VICAVLDTNTVVSGVGWGGPPGFEQLLESAADARHAMVALLRTAEAAG
jgi:hypothetical protein